MDTKKYLGWLTLATGGYASLVITSFKCMDGVGGLTMLFSLSFLTFLISVTALYRTFNK